MLRISRFVRLSTSQTSGIPISFYQPNYFLQTARFSTLKSTEHHESNPSILTAKATSIPNEPLNQTNVTPEKSTSTLPQQADKLKLADFFELTKFKLSIMNTLVSLPTYIFYSGNITSGLWIPLAIATQLMAMSSQVTNQILEKDYDAQMIRTQRRPLPTEMISKQKAWMIAGSTFLLSNALFLSVFPTQTAVVANAIFFGYIGIYTPMKRWTNFNTAVGAVIGALTPYIGYAAAGGSLTDLYPLYYAAYMTFWQFQHFYGIAWIYKNDYLRAGYKMCHDKNEALFYMASSFALNVATNIALFCTNPVYPVLPYAYSSIMAFMYITKFIAPTIQFYKDPNVQTAQKLKTASYLHLAAFFSIILFDMCLRIYQIRCKKHVEETQTTDPTNPVTDKAPEKNYHSYHNLFHANFFQKFMSKPQEPTQTVAQQQPPTTKQEEQPKQ